MPDEFDRPIKIHSGDAALIKAAQTGEGLVPVTRDMINDVGVRVKQEQRKLDNIEAVIADIPYEVRLTVAAWVFGHICAHAREGGSYRYLIYERLGFDTDAYVPLYLAGGMDISNDFVLPVEPPPRKMEEGDL